jgi:hypothetical protein
MKSTELMKPILEGGVRSINFFNGRLLSGEDLTREQAAQREWLGRLGRLFGGGVASGLSITPHPTPGKPAVIVEPGLAVTAQGQTLSLSESFEVSILRPGQPEAAALPVARAGFADCQPLESGIYKTGDGLYLLTIAPATGVEGRVPTSGLGNESASCATRYLVDAVKFRLLALTQAFSAAELDDEPHLQNLLAARCFGVADAASFASDPFGGVAAPRLLDTLGKKLSAHDVPLAVLHWKEDGGLRFVDMWCVRRRLSGQEGETWLGPALSARRGAEAEALLMQFQEHIDLLRQRPPVESFVATTSFRYLPPAGLLPLGPTSGFRGFTTDRFFSGLKARDGLFIEGARVEPLLRAALSLPPIDLQSGEMLWVYRVRENAMRVDGLVGAQVQPYAIFASGQLPYWADAHFDVAHFNYASFS